MSGTPHDGRWSCVLTIPEWARVGEWMVSEVVLYDIEKNGRVLDPDALRALPSLTVTGPAT